ncbi:alpha/beta fold hydrolase [Rubidibacter lacunae]|nr:alpha/beta fold hydrolase [Rubidibacter lacunae]
MKIGYRVCGDRGPAVVCVHGFGASSGHWRKNLPVLGVTCRCYAIDLLGFGASDKPQPGGDVAYTFETWGQQIVDFCRDVVGEPAFLIGNSIGCIAAMQAAVDAPDLARGVAMLNVSLRLLHDRKRATLPWYRSFGAPIVQKLLASKPIGHFFFQRIARPAVVRRLLLEAYGRPDAVTDELVELILEPARTPGAADVFLSFVRYSQGPLPEDLLPELSCPTIVLWGENDPWEPIALGRAVVEGSPTVERFVSLAGLGHCPQDEAPDIVNPILQTWIDERTAAIA